MKLWKLRKLRELPDQTSVFLIITETNIVMVLGIY